MAGVFIDISGNAIPRLSLLAGKAEQPETVLDEIGAFLDSDVMHRFSREMSPGGAKWEQSEAAKERSGLTLTDTRNLADSITHNVQGNTLEHGLGEVYAAVHHFGGKVGRNKSVTLPARPIVGIDTYQADEINDIIDDWLI
ncbi:phage virion morphogenesis protein [Pseudoalteromonas denitrificans]|uniref:Phage virion morphogenesis (Putative tail completion) protein n=1 Tax=Pseudoalteromonas denitrificans DSM 6059 TaxID=1123010 RepID=A0A1I1T912_9GAMM|nr:phage virion morphogenesis protein [Pseudoalteromonas denitrificans]SFD55104.1 phage virion morphogenesis (putative tail completion) protein [Pseudoalteromonas denitrificans DSM 6059]